MDLKWIGHLNLFLIGFLLLGVMKRFLHTLVPRRWVRITGILYVCMFVRSKNVICFCNENKNLIHLQFANSNLDTAG